MAGPACIFVGNDEGLIDCLDIGILASYRAEQLQHGAVANSNNITQERRVPYYFSLTVSTTGPWYVRRPQNT